MEARDKKRLLRLQSQLDAVKPLIVDELGYPPLSQTGAELLFEGFGRRHERASTLATSNLPFDEWTGAIPARRPSPTLIPPPARSPPDLNDFIENAPRA